MRSGRNVLDAQVEVGTASGHYEALTPAFTTQQDNLTPSQRLFIACLLRVTNPQYGTLAGQRGGSSRQLMTSSLIRRNFGEQTSQFWESVRLIQDVIHDAQQSSYVLANAAMMDVFAESNQTPVKPSKALPNNAAGDLAPWLRRFVQSAVSASGIRPLRYAILNFVQRAPTGFIELIRRELGDDARISCCALVPTAELPPRCNGQLPVIALDIFAHWLVLLLLLDEVWWIGPIGDFELGRLTERVAELRSDERENKVSSTDWWPGRMHAMYKGSHTE
ncbi:hypothetical protein B0A48_12679 [Cryoendolithus antarcticus]|uniref:Uncharacterized protein n=1 Tax=Cryoendolithus antarcticus TaxID=1507870 RepID=A0A1V8SR54_9PEZI|nr:hypothetical protein B0A48_12679 [Cryoendolithus antarcticus]